MRVIVIGGRGKVARKLTPILTERGHAVTAVVRNPGHVPDVEGDGATAALADIESLDTTALADLVRGHDAVVWSAGAGGGDPARTRAVDREAAIRSMVAAAEAGVERYVMVSYFGAGPDHGVPQEDPFHHYAEAKAAADCHLQDSGLAWTILRPSRLTDDAPTGRIETARGGATAGQVSRGDVALVVAETLERPDLRGQVVEFNNGEVPVRDALTSHEC
jgi:uncharacterized protein YbjT (DUF2867 family)